MFKKWLSILLVLLTLVPTPAIAVTPNLNITTDMTGGQYMAQMNTNLQAINSWFYGSTDPASYTPSQAYPGAWWIDTGNNLVKQRNAANTAWVAKGTVGSDGTILWSNVPYSFRNKLVNGDMRVWQRGTSFSGVSAGTYTSDRWIINYISSGSLTVSRSTDVPSGYLYSLSFAGTGGSLGQRIESINCNDLIGQSVTVSFWAKNVSGADNLAVYLYSANSTDNFGGVTLIGSTTVASSPSSSWTYYTATFSSLPANVANGLYLVISRGAGATSSTLFTGVQLEKGAINTPYEFLPYQVQYAMCRRYFKDYGLTWGFIGQAFSATSGQFVVPFDVPMRVTPTLISNNSGAVTNPSGSTQAMTGLSAAGMHSAYAGVLTFTVGANLAAGNAVLAFSNSAGTLQFIAEL